MIIFSKVGYHSSPYEIEKFENKTPDNKAKTGEGAMVHGWGLYVQADKTINTERYKNRLSGIPLLNFGKGWIDMRKWSLCDISDMNEYDRVYDCFDIITRIYASCKQEGYSIGLLFEKGGVEEFKKHMISYINSEYGQYEKEADSEVQLKFAKIEHQNKLNAVNLLQDIKMNTITQYTVEIPDDMIFVEEELPCNQQNKIVQKAIQTKSMSLYQMPDMYDDDDWSDFYRENTDFDKDGYALCKFLSENGVDGIHYNGGRDGECWVIFNCEKVKIIAKE